MKLKDFIKVIVFSIIGFIMSMVGGYMSMLFGPLMFFIGSGIGSIFTAPVFVTMVKKISKRGVVFIFYFINGLVYLLMGMWPMFVVVLMSAIIGELFVWNRGYENNKKIGLSYVISQLIYALHGLYFLIYFGAKGLSEQFSSMFTLEYAQQIKAFYFNPLNLSIVVIIQIVLSIIGFYIGLKIYNKFFCKKQSQKESVLGK